MGLKSLLDAARKATRMPSLEQVFREDRKQRQAIRNQELDRLRQRAVMQRINDRAQYRMLTSYSDGKGRVRTYRKVGEPNMSYITFELEGLTEEPLLLTTRYGVTYLPTIYALWMSEPCIEFYSGILNHADCTHCIIVVRSSVFKVPAQVLKLNALSSTTSIGLDKKVFVAMKHIMPYKIN